MLELVGGPGATAARAARCVSLLLSQVPSVHSEARVPPVGSAWCCSQQLVLSWASDSLHDGSAKACVGTKWEPHPSSCSEAAESGSLRTRSHSLIWKHFCPALPPAYHKSSHAGHTLQQTLGLGEKVLGLVVIERSVGPTVGAVGCVLAPGSVWGRSPTGT